jgi:hypothetical protein
VLSVTLVCLLVRNAEWLLTVHPFVSDLFTPLVAKTGSLSAVRNEACEETTQPFVSPRKTALVSRTATRACAFVAAMPCAAVANAEAFVNTSAGSCAKATGWPFVATPAPARLASDTDARTLLPLPDSVPVTPATAMLLIPPPPPPPVIVNAAPLVIGLPFIVAPPFVSTFPPPLAVNAPFTVVPSWNVTLQPLPAPHVMHVAFPDDIRDPPAEDAALTPESVAIELLVIPPAEAT